jgi:hypothetical protein
MNWEEQLGLKFSAFTAGIVGGIISLTFETKLSFIRALTLIFVGGITAGYSFNAAVHYLGMSHEAMGLFSFTIGLISMRLVNTIMNIGRVIQNDPSVILSIPKILTELKDVRNSTIDSRNNGNVNVNILTPGETNPERKDNI